MEVVRTLIVEHSGGESLKRLLEDFRDMVNYAIAQGLEKGYSMKRLHQACYLVFKERYDYHTLWYPMAYRVASSIIRTWKKKRRGEGEPRMRKKIVRVHKKLYKLDLELGVLLLRVRANEVVEISLKLGDFHKEALKSGEPKELLLNEKHVFIPVGYEIDLCTPEGFVAIDVNEDNITYVSMDGRAGKIHLGVKRLRETYHEKRRRVQKNVRGKHRNALLRKYGGRERRRVADVLHKVTRFLADRFKGYGFVLEDLKGLRSAANRKVKKYNRKNGKVQEVFVVPKEMKRRLNSMPFRRIQSYIEYKALLNGSPVDYVPARNTSKVCARCGYKFLRACPTCGLDGTLELGRAF